MNIIQWISKYVTLLTLLVNIGLMIITLIYTLINRRVLHLASQPTIKIRPKNIWIHPDILDTAKIEENDDDLEKDRYCVGIDFELANIGTHSAQNIYFDAEAHFIDRKPLGKKYLPIHLPEFLAFISAEKDNNNDQVKVSARFDNYVARELIRDFFKGRSHFKGMAFLPSRKEIENREIWPSPKIIIRCFYSDIQGQNYVSELRLFFHIWRDKEHNKLGIYILNSQELEFMGIRKISKRYRDNYIQKTRHLRYISFDGKEYSKNDLLVLRAKQKR